MSLEGSGQSDENQQSTEGDVEIQFEGSVDAVSSSVSLDDLVADGFDPASAEA